MRVAAAIPPKSKSEPVEVSNSHAFPPPRRGASVVVVVVVVAIFEAQRSIQGKHSIECVEVIRVE